MMRTGNTDSPEEKITQVVLEPSTKNEQTPVEIRNAEGITWVEGDAVPMVTQNNNYLSEKVTLPLVMGLESLNDIEDDDQEFQSLLKPGGLLGFEVEKGTEVKEKGFHCSELPSPSNPPRSSLDKLSKAWTLFKSSPSILSDFLFSKQKSKAIQKLAACYHAEIVHCFGGRENIPEDVHVLLDAFACNRLSPLPGSSEKNKLTLEFMEEVKLLLVMQDSKILMEEISDIQCLLREIVGLNGFIKKTELEYELLENVLHEIFLTGERLDAVYSVLGRNVHCLVTCMSMDENLSDALNLTTNHSKYLREKLKACSNARILASRIDEMQDCCQALYTVLVKVILTTAWYYHLPVIETGYYVRAIKLKLILEDMKIIISSAIQAFRSIRQVYEDKAAMREKERLRLKELRLRAFSKEGKLRRTCIINTDLLGDLNRYMALLKIESNKLADSNLTTESDEYQAIVRLMLFYQKKVEDSHLILGSVLDAQACLVSSLTPPSLEAKPSELASLENLRKRDEERELAGRGKTDKLEDSVPPNKLVYDDMGSVPDHGEAEPDQRESANYEVYVGMFGDEDEHLNSTNSQYCDFDLEEKRQHKRLYSGVVCQLKTALLPVKKTTQAREREAILKTFGKLEGKPETDIEENENDHDLSEEENPPENVPIISAGEEEDGSKIKPSRPDDQIVLEEKEKENSSQAQTETETRRIFSQERKHINHDYTEEGNSGGESRQSSSSGTGSLSASLPIAINRPRGFDYHERRSRRGHQEEEVVHFVAPPGFLSELTLKLIGTEGDEKLGDCSDED